MSFFLRAPNRELGSLRREPDGVFVAAVPLVMHDACAMAHGVGGHPSDIGRDAFSEQAGQDLCWWPGSYGGDHPCYWCGKRA